MKTFDNKVLQELLARYVAPPVRFDPQPVHVVVVATERGTEADDASAN